MVFSVDETTNKVAVCAGVPEKSDKSKKLEVSEWLTAALKPLNGRCGKGKGGLATGQVSSDVVLKGLKSIYLFKFDIFPRNKLNKLKPNMVNIINSIADARSTLGSLLILFVLNINIKIKYLMKLLMKIVLESAFKKKKKIHLSTSNEQRLPFFSLSINIMMVLFQGTDGVHVDKAMDLAATFAQMKLTG